MPIDINVGEDWQDSDKDLNTTGSADVGPLTVTGNAGVSGTITGATLMQGVNQALDVSDLVPATIVNESEIVNTGPSAPPSTFAGKFWFDTANNLIKIRNEADTGWLDIWDTANNKPIIANLTDEILGTMLAPTVAGSGLAQDGSGNLDVTVDDSTLEIAADILRVKNLGITETKIALAALGVKVSANDTTRGVLNGKLVAGDFVTLTEGNDGADEILTIAAPLIGAQISQTFQSITNASLTQLQFDTTQFDVGGAQNFYLPGTNAHALTVPTTGVSKVIITLQCLGTLITAGTDVWINLRKNGSALADSGYWLQTTPNTALATYGGPCYVSPIISVAAGDYFTGYIYHNDSVARSFAPNLTLQVVDI